MGNGEVTPDAEAKQCRVGCVWNVVSEKHGTRGLHSWSLMAAHSSPSGRPAVEAQRKPRLSEAESGVLPILPPEKGRRNGHLLRKAQLGLRRSGSLRTLGRMIGKEIWCEGRSFVRTTLGGKERRDLGEERVALKDIIRGQNL